MRALNIRWPVVAIGFIVALFLALIFTGPSKVDALELSNVAPTPANSLDGDGNPGAHVFFIRKASVQGIQPDIKLSAYYNNVPNGTRIKLSTNTSSTVSNVCNVATNPAPAGADRPTYLSVLIRDGTNAANQRLYYISYANACASSPGFDNSLGQVASNIFYADYLVPNIPVANRDPQTNLYKLDIIIRYGAGVPTPANASSGFGQRIVVTSTVSSAKVGPLGGQNQSFPILGDWDIVGAGKPTNIRVPFGLPCNAPAQSRSVSLYDADNGDLGVGGFYPWYVRFKVQMELDDGTWQDVALNNQQYHDAAGSNLYLFQPEDGLPDPNRIPRADVNLLPKEQYRMLITGLMPRNTIDVGLPGDAIFGTIDCDTPDVNNPTPLPPQTVRLTPNISSTGDFEVGSTTTMTGSVTVANFPQPVIGGWGYSEQGVRRAVNTNTPPNQNSYDARQGNEDVTASGQVQKWRLCAGGNYNLTCANYRCQNGSTTSNGSTGCGNYNWQCRWTSPNGVVKVNNVGWAPPTPGCRIFQYQCRDASGNFTNDVFKDYNANETTAETNYCNNRFNCPGPSGEPTFYDPSFGPGVCKIFYCAYNPGSTFYAPGSNPDGNCAVRCDNGAGAPPYKWVSDGDPNCYIHPYFVLRCTWTTSDGQSAIADQIIGDNTPAACARSFNIGTGSLTVQACLSLASASSLSGNNFTDSGGSTWLSYGKQPGHGMGMVGGSMQPFKYRDWFIGTTSGSLCVDAFSTPYFKVFGSDVRVGGGITASTGCMTNTLAQIRGWNRGSGGSPQYSGAGAQYAAIATGQIDGFASGLYNNRNASPSATNGGFTAPGTAMSFANTGVPSPYGGDFGSTGVPSCVSYVDPGVVPTPAPATPITLPALTPGQITTQYYRGDVFINSNFAYNFGAGLGGLMSYRLVVDGNIYIGKDVTRLDGTYVAIANTDASKGIIYDCADGIGAVPDRTLSGCEKQLVVNGSFAARQVQLLRDCGSVVYAINDNSYVEAGSNAVDVAQCTAASHAGEVFNYSPELWLVPLNSPSYNSGADSILSLPPIL